MKTEILTKTELQLMQTTYCNLINDYDYNKYKNIVDIHNINKNGLPAAGDIMICKSLDGKRVYNNGHIEYQDLGKFSSICTEPYMPFISIHNNKIYVNASGGYWFSIDKEPVRHKGFRSKKFCSWGHCGPRADGAFYLDLIVNVWEVHSKAIY